MHKLIEEYFQSLVDALSASPVVASSDAALDKRGPRAGLIRGEARFVDRSRLNFSELVADIQTAIVRTMYSFHYQNSNDELIFRYDDTPHHPEVTSFPHHKHSGETVLPTEPPTLETVLKEITTTIVDSKQQSDTDSSES
jgi:hypothetical protein